MKSSFWLKFWHPCSYFDSETDKKNALQILKEELKGLEDAIREENKVEESAKELMKL